MKVAIDFRSIPFSGIWNYSNHLMEGLQEKGVEVYPVHLPDHLIRASSLAYLQGIRRLIWENSTMHSAFRSVSAQIFHCTNNYGLPLILDRPSVLTVHDFIPLELSEVYLPQFRKRLAYRTFLKHSIQAATRIITISDYTQEVLLRRFPMAAKKTERVYHGCGKQYRRLEDSVAMARTREKLKLPEDFVLAMGGDRTTEKCFECGGNISGSLG